MSKLFMAIFCLIISQTVYGQLMREHVYDRTLGVATVNIEGDGTKYIAVDSATKRVLLFNEDHSVWKEIKTTLPAGAQFRGVSCVSRRLINIDDEIELAFFYAKYEAPDWIYKTDIYKEDGSIYQSLLNTSGCYPIKVNTKWKIIAYKPNDVYEIYSVPGEYLGVSSPGSAGATAGDASFFPNPMELSATLKYTLPAGTHTASLNIYDMAGAMVRTYQVSDQFSEILVARNDLPAGTYVYKLSAPGVELPADRFTIK